MDTGYAMGAGAEAVLGIVLRLRNEMSKELGGVRSQLQGIATSAAGVGLGLAGVSAPIIALARDAINTAATFEAQMNVLSTAARSSGTSMEELSRAAVLVGSDTQLVGISSTEAADALTNFYKAGLDTTEIFGGQLNQYLATGTNLTGALRSAIDLAAASELDLNQASMLTSVAMSTFNLNADQATRIANSFVGAADASVASVADLYAGMQNLGPTAAAFGLSLEETNTALALLSTRGIMGAEAGTAFKSMLNNLISGTSAVNGALQELNITLYDANGNMKSWPTILGQIEGALQGVTQEQRDHYVLTLAGAYGQKALNTVLAEGSAGWAEMSAAVAGAASAQDVALAQTKGWRAALEQLRGTVESVYINVGKPLLEQFLTPFIQRVTQLIGGINTLNPQVRNAALAFAAVLAVASPLALAIAGIATVMGALAAPIGLVVLAVGGLAAAFAGDFGGIRATLFEFAEQLKLVLTTALLLPTIFGTWYRATGDLGTAFGKVGDALGALARGVPALEPVIEAVQRVIGVVQAHAAEVQAAVGAAWEGIVGFVQDKVNAFVAAIRYGVLFVEILFRMHHSQIVSVVQTAWGFILGYIQNQITFFTSLFQAGLALLRGDWDGAWTLLGQAVQAKFGGIIDFITGGTGSITTAFETLRPIVDTVTGIFTDIWSSVSTLLGSIIGSVADSASTVQANFSRAWDAVVGIVGGVLSGVLSIVQSLLGALRGFVEQHGQEIQAFLAGAWVAISNIIATALQIIQATVVPIITAIAGFIRNHSAEIQAVLGAAWTAIRTVIDVALTAIQGVLRAVLQVIQGDWSGAWETLKSTGETIWEKIKAAVTDIAQKLGPILANIWEGIKGKAEEIWGNLKGAAERLWENVKAAVVAKVQEILAAVLKWLDDTLVKIEGFDLKAAAQQFFGTILPGIAAKVMEALTAVGKFLTDIWTKITGYDLKGAAQTSFATVIAGIGEKVGTALTNVGTFLTDIATKIREHTFKSETLTAIQTVVAGIIEKAGEVLTAVGNFLADIAKKISEFDLKAAGTALIQGLIGGITSMAQQVLEAATGVVQGAIDAAKKLLGIQSPSKVFAEIGQLSIAGLAQGFDDAKPVSLQALGLHINAIVQELQRLANEVIEPAAVASAKAITDPLAAIFQNVIKIVEGVNNLAGLQLPVVIDAQLQAVSDAVRIVVYHLQDMANNLIKAEAVWSAKAFSDPVGVIFDNVKKIVEGASALADFAGGAVDPAQLTAGVGVLKTVIDALVKALDEVAQGLPDLGAAAAGLALNAGPVLQIVEPAIAAFRALMTQGFALEGDWLDADNYTLMLARIRGLALFIGELAYALGEVGRQIGDKLLTAAKLLGESVGPVIALVEPAITAFRLLMTQGFALEGDWLDTDNYTLMLARIRGLALFVGELAYALGEVGRQVGEKLLTAAKSLGESVGPVIGIIEPAIAGFRTLMTQGFTVDQDWASDSYTPMLEKIRGLALFVGELAYALGEVGRQIGEALLGAAKAFAENVGPVLGLIEPALAAFAVLATLVVPDMGRFYAGMNALVQFVGWLAWSLAQIAATVNADMQAAARAFGEAAGPVVGFVKAGVEAFTAVASLVVPPDMGRFYAGMNAFAQFVGWLAWSLAQIAKTVDADMQAAAKAFGEAAGPVVGFVKTGVEAFGAVAGLVMPADMGTFYLGMNHLAQFVGWLTWALAQITLTVTTDLQRAAKGFAENVGPVLAVVKGAVDALGAFAVEIVPPTQADVAGLTQFMAVLVAELAAATQHISTEVLGAARAFAEQVGPVTSAVGGAVSALRALTEVPQFKLAGAPTWIRQVAGYVATMVTELAAAKTDDASLATARQFAADAKGVIDLVSAAIQQVQVLATARRVPAGSAYRIVEDMVTLVRQVRKAAKEFGGGIMAEVTGFAGAAELVGSALAAGLAAIKGTGQSDAARTLAGAMDVLVAAVRAGVGIIRGQFDVLVEAAYAAGLGWAAQLAAGIAAGLPLLEAAVQSVANLFPHSPAKAGPLREAPDWSAFLLGGLVPVAGQVASALAGATGGAAYGPVGTWGPSVTPVGARGGGGSTVINFTYAPAVSLASQREAEEVLAPVLLRVAAREGRRS